MVRFIYVKSELDKEKMLELGYSLMKEDSKNGVWVFLNKNVKTFDYDGKIAKAGIQFALSNTLTF